MKKRISVKGMNDQCADQHAKVRLAGASSPEGFGASTGLIGSTGVRRENLLESHRPAGLAANAGRTKREYATISDQDETYTETFTMSKNQSDFAREEQDEVTTDQMESRITQRILEFHSALVARGQIKPVPPKHVLTPVAESAA
ncbi:MAG: hypothetical protein F4X97_06315 [Boseongicola sp. SB0662_bin_57]|nr:hypothetical protein [Boseongicola sp. SB0662_bin_57]